MSEHRLDSLEQLRSTGRDLVSLLSGVSDDHLARRPEEAEWSAREIISHLADAELTYAMRLRLIVAQDRPRLTWYDEEAWVERFGPLDEDARNTLARWRALRDSNTRLFESLEGAEWERAGIHDTDGLLTVDAIAKRMVAHDRTHLDQIRAALSRR
ncbi:MAG: hypothetical protein QOE35_2067 [Actinomycetota bacterium]|jgi:uncharacterized damage-inducible protein DinB